MNHESTGRQNLDTGDKATSDLEALIEGADLARLKQAVREFEHRGQKSIVCMLRDTIRMKEMNDNSTVDVETLTQLVEYFKQEGKSETDLKPMRDEIERQTVEDARFLATLERNLQNAFDALRTKKVDLSKKVDPRMREVEVLWHKFEELRKPKTKANNLDSTPYAERLIQKLYEIRNLLRAIGQHEKGVTKVNQMINAIQQSSERKINRGASRQNPVRNDELVEAGV